VTRRLIAEFSRARTADRRAVPANSRALASLTARERETLELIAKGLTNGEIAAAMYVGEATVKTHVGNVLMKLGMRDRVQAVIFAYEHGVVSA
jgi:DNA-binding NarL/FixJ family response regulator